MLSEHIIIKVELIFKTIDLKNSIKIQWEIPQNKSNRKNDYKGAIYNY